MIKCLWNNTAAENQANDRAATTYTDTLMALKESKPTVMTLLSIYHANTQRLNIVCPLICKECVNSVPTNMQRVCE